MASLTRLDFPTTGRVNTTRVFAEGRSAYGAGKLLGKPMTSAVSPEKIASLGFEPKQTESKSVVLPLHHEAVSVFPFGGQQGNGSSNNDKHKFCEIEKCDRKKMPWIRAGRTNPPRHVFYLP